MHIEKLEGDKFGMEVSDMDPATDEFTINRIVETSDAVTLAKFNAANPGDAIRKGDRIVSVNAAVGNEIWPEFKKTSLDLKMKREPSREEMARAVSESGLGLLKSAKAYKERMVKILGNWAQDRPASEEL